MLLSMRAERKAQRAMQRALQARLEALSVEHGERAPMTEVFWLEVWRVIVTEPWATCGNLGAAVQAMRGCQTAIRELAGVEDKSKPLHAFREMTQRVLRLVQEGDHG